MSGPYLQKKANNSPSNTTCFSSRLPPRLPSMSRKHSSRLVRSSTRSSKRALSIWQEKVAPTCHESLLPSAVLLPLPKLRMTSHAALNKLHRGITHSTLALASDSMKKKQTKKLLDLFEPSKPMLLVLLFQMYINQLLTVTNRVISIH